MGVSLSIGLANDFFIVVGFHGNLRASPARVHNLQSTVLYQSVARAWPKIDIEYAINDQSVAPHVTAEFERYKRCRILEHGFVRLYCKDGQAERVIGFSCKGRGFCPACGSRRGLQKADRIEQEVWPQAKARQWVMPFPYQVRSWLLRIPELFNEVISIVVDSIYFHYEQHAELALGQDHIYLPTAGSVSFVQFFGSSLTPNPHLHMMFLR